MLTATRETRSTRDPDRLRTVLLAEDDPTLARATARLLRTAGWTVETVSDGAQALAAVEARPFSVVLLDLRLPVHDGLEVLTMLQRRVDPPPVVLVSGYLDVETTVRALRSGAHQILEKPVGAKHLIRILDEAGADADGEEPTAAPVIEWVGRSVAAQRVRDEIERAGAYEQVPVLIIGETGTGKEVVAQALHRQSGATAPMVSLNCAAIPNELFESELFGHEVGAFTGARASRVGLLEAAGDGVVFLDEIGEMPSGQQAKLLRVLETRRFRRVGSATPIALRARIVSATNRELTGRETDGLRPDLYFRLAGFTIRTPALRHRPADIEELARHLLRELRAHYPEFPASFSPEALEALGTHDWPGNVRELRSVIQSSALRSRGELVRVHSVVEALRERGYLSDPARESGVHRKVQSLPDRRDSEVPPPMGLRDMEREAILSALEECSGNLSRTARRLGIPRSTLRDKVRRYGQG